MAGQPNTRRIRAELAHTIEQLGGDDYVFALIAGGEEQKPLSIAKIAKHLKVYRGHLDAWLKEGERPAMLIEARKAAAEWHAERSGEVLDEAGEGMLITGPDVSLATSRSKWHQWMATVNDRARFGEQPASVNVQVNGAVLHLEALTKLGSLPPTARASLPEPELMTAEIVTDDPVKELAAV